jgi:VWFA-related protein
MKRIVVGLIVLSGLWSLPRPADSGSGYVQKKQENQKKEESLRLSTELVQLDVVVTDKNNHPVTDLKKENFVVSEEGKPQTVSFFSLVRPASPAPNEPEITPSGLPPVIAPEPGRFIFIILDQYHISRDSYSRLREALVGFVTNDIAPEDQVAIIGTGGSLAVFQQVTKNTKALTMAINALLGSGAEYTAATAIDQEFSAVQQAVGMPASLSASLYGEYILRATLQTLESLAKGIGDLPGRKIAIFVSENLPIFLTGATSPLENLSQELEQVISRSRRGGLTFYTLDPRGLVADIPGGSAAEARSGSMLGGGSLREPPGATSDKLLESRWGLRELAGATGGFSILNTNNPRTGLQRVLAENDAYYLLAYYPPSDVREGKFRKVKVEVPGRPDLTVRTRKGYIAQSQAERDNHKAEDKQERIKGSLASLVPIRNVRVSIPRLEATNDFASGGWVARMVVQVDVRSWPFKEEKGIRSGSLEVIAFAYDLRNKLVDGFSKTVNMKLKPDIYERVLKEGANLKGEVKLGKSGLYNIRVVVINTDTKEIGTASDWVIAK